MAHTPTPELPQHILIIGGGTAGWMTANLLQHRWQSKGVKISLLESEDIGIIGVGEGSTPFLKQFFKQLNIKEEEWMPACNATYKCGIRFPNWSTKSGFEEYYHPFYSPLDLKTGEAFFHNANLRRRGFDAEAHPDHFWVSTELSNQCLSPNSKHPLPFDYDYGYHFDAGLLGAFLKNRGKKKGVNHIVDTVVQVEQNDLGIQGVVTKESGYIEADFFVDCSGFASLLIGKTLKTEFRSYSDVLFNDRAVALPSYMDKQGPLPSQTLSEAMSAGWRWKIPLTNRYGNGYVYSSNYLSEEEAEKELRDVLGNSILSDQPARHLKMRVGRMEKHWSKNCLAIGLSQGFIEPLEATALMLVQFSIERFIAGYQQSNSTSEIKVQQNQYNNEINKSFDAIRDYIVTHYKLNSRDDSQYWRDNRNNELKSNRLKAIFSAWKNGGDLESTLNEYKGQIGYLRPSWYCIFAGMGEFPQALAPLPSDLTAAPAHLANEYCKVQAENFIDHWQALDKLKSVAKTSGFSVED